MKLLRKVVKSSQILKADNSVSIDNTVVIKSQKMLDIYDTHFSDEEKDEFQKIISEEKRNVRERLEKEYQQKLNHLNEEANNYKSQLISNAISECEKMRNDCQIDILVKEQKAISEGEKSGYKDGYEKAKQEVFSEFRESLDGISKLLNDINEKKNDLLVKYENDLIDMSVFMAEKILMSELSLNKDAIFSIIKQACKSFRNSDYVKISIPKGSIDEQLITDKEFLKTIAGNIPEIEFEFLTDVDEGVVILDNGREIIDAGIPTQIDLLREIADAKKQRLQ